MTQRAIRFTALGLLVAAAVVVFVLWRGASEDPHKVFVTVPDATGMVSGQFVRAGGNLVGKVASVTPAERGRNAKIGIELDDTVWPLKEGTRFTLRWGGTINLFNRYLMLEPGDGKATMARDGGEFPAEAFDVPVEYGELINVFDKQLRKDTKSLLDNAGATMDRAGKPLNDALGKLPGAAREADAVLSDLDQSRGEVSALVNSTADVVDSIDRSSPELGELIVAAGTTLSAVSADVGSLQSTLDRAPGTLAAASRTLRNADPVLISARDVTDRLAPGVTELRRTVRPLNRTLDTLLDVAPDASQTLDTLETAAPDLTKLVKRVGDESPRLESIGKQADVALNCIRPYAPEIASFGTLWGSALSNTDGRDNYIRAQPTLLLPAPSNADSRTSGEAAKLYPGLTFGFPRPPGTQAGQPWFLPECGAGPDAIDPDKDPEARRPFPQQMLIPEMRSGK